MGNNPTPLATNPDQFNLSRTASQTVGREGNNQGEAPPPSPSTDRSMATEKPETFKFPKPPTFNGERGFFTSWITDVLHYFNSVGITSDTNKINYTLALLTHPATYWKEQWISAHTTIEGYSPGDWSTFYQELADAYDPLPNQADAEEKLRTLRQNGRPIEQYISEFTTLAGRAGIAGENAQTALVAYFRAGLDDAVKIEATRANPKNTLEEWKSAATAAGRVIQEIQRCKGTRTVNYTHYKRYKKPRGFKQGNQKKNTNQYVPSYQQRRPPPGAGNAGYYDMDIDLLEQINNITSNQSTYWDSSDEENSDSTSDASEDNLSSDESDEEVNNLRTAKGRKGNSNGTNNVKFKQFLNLILTDKQKQALQNQACFECGQKGHFARECPQRPKQRNNSYSNLPRNSASKNYKRHKGQKKRTRQLNLIEDDNNNSDAENFH